LKPWRSALGAWHPPRYGSGRMPLSEECPEHAPRTDESPEVHVAGFVGVGSSGGWSGWRVTGLRELREVEVTPF
jgi:hypothetical protein